ncbi:MAG: putative toxin-antitoxin system toxin component, PIN family [Rubrivivax sp.]|nr:putative toxin-antitoxin system toxin component, PIN family [Rubrivivax sp.]
MSSGKRIVFDTSILVGAVLKPRSVPAKALSWAWEVAEVVVSAQTLDELRVVLGRDRLDAFRARDARESFFEFYRAMTVLVPASEAVAACRDPKDDKFLSLAVSAGASLLVSSDDDLLTLGRYREVAILRPKQFVELCE